MKNSLLFVLSFLAFRSYTQPILLIEPDPALVIESDLNLENHPDFTAEANLMVCI